MKLSKDTLLSQLTLGQLETILSLFNLIDKTQESNSLYLNTNEAASFIRKSPQALRQIVFNRKIKSIKRGNNLLFLKSDLIDWMEEGRKVDSNEILPIVGMRKSKNRG